jgi:hypothetical protein
MWGFFHQRICLSTIKAEWNKAEAEFARVGLTADRFQSIPDELGPQASFSKSARAILFNFYQAGYKTLLHLEDDCQFQDLSHLPAALAQLPRDWDIVYLGANLILNDECKPPKRPDRYSENLFRIYGAWTTHAIGYNRKCVEHILQFQPPINGRMYDTYLSDELPKLNAFVVAPMVAYQRPRISSIWGRFDDYTEIFTLSEQRLK